MLPLILAVIPHNPLPQMPLPSLGKPPLPVAGSLQTPTQLEQHLAAEGL